MENANKKIAKDFDQYVKRATNYFHLIGLDKIHKFGSTSSRNINWRGKKLTYWK